MLKRFNMLALIVLLVFQTMIAPVAATAQGIPGQGNGDPNVTEDVNAEEEETSENTEVEDANKVESAEENTSEGENEDAVKDETAEDGALEDENEDPSEENSESGEETDVNEEDPEEESETTEADESDVNETDPAEKEGFRLEIGKVTDFQGNEYTGDKKLNPTDEFSFNLDWHLENNHTYTNGDSIEFDLPKQVYIHEEMTDRELKDGFGETIAHYTVTTDNKIKLTFTDYVDKHSDVEGFIGIEAKLNPNEVEIVDGEVTIEPIGDGGAIVLPVNPPNNNKEVSKSGKPATDYNAEEINWTVTANRSGADLKDAKVIDNLPEGLAYKEDSLKVTKYKTNLLGEVVGEGEEIEITPEINGQELTIPLGDTKDKYVVEYTTEITDMTKANFTNNVKLVDENKPDTPAGATVPINRGEPIKKTAVKGYDPITGIIEWELEFNYDQKSLDNVTLTDTWKPAGNIALEGAVEIIEVTIDGNGHATDVGPVELGTVNEITDGFEVTGITTDKAYKVKYKTKVINRVIDGFTMENVASFGDDNESGRGTWIGQNYGVKTAGNVNYNEKTIDWTITLNQDKHPMKNITIADTYTEGQTLKAGSVDVKIGGVEYTGYTLSGEGENSFSIEFPEDHETREIVVITYKSDYDPNTVGNNPENTALVDWTPEGSDDRIGEKELKAGTNINWKNGSNHWKDGSYNPDTKKITWELIVNYRGNQYDELIITDTPVGNQKLVTNSIKVEELEIDKHGNEKKVTDVENPNVTTATEDGFTLNLAETDKTYKVIYETSIADAEHIQESYKNDVEVSDGTGKADKVSKSVGIPKANEYSSKVGKEVGKTIEWKIDVNPGQHKVTGLTLTDTISDNQAYLQDTITVYEAKVDGNGNAIKGEPYNPELYELVHEADTQTFEIKWKNEIERAFVVEYSTLFFANKGEAVTNDFKVTGENLKEGANQGGQQSVTIDRYDSSGGSGKAGFLIIDKVDKEGKKLAGAKFELRDNETGKVLMSGVTDEEGQISFGRLRFDDYTLVETETPEGYVAATDEHTITIDKEYHPDTDKKEYAHKVENYVPVFAIDLLKTGNNSEVLAGAEFTLFDSSDNEVATGTTDADGKILFAELENAGTYYVQETKAPAGYILDETKHEVTIGEKEPEPVGLSVSNTPRGAVQLTKTDVDTKEALEGVEFELQKLSDSGEYETVETDEPLITDENGIIKTSNTLEAGDYQFVETQALEGYRTDGEPIKFEVDVKDTNEQKFTMTNEKFKGSVKLIKSDAATEDVLKGAEFKLVDSEDEVVKEGLVTNNDGEIVVDNLLLGNYQLIETSAPEGYELDETPIDVEITEDGQVVEKTIENHKITNVTVEKQWNNAGGDTTPVTVKLLPTDQTVELNEENDWKATFNDLRVFDESGEEINYEVEELEVDGYASTVTGDKQAGFIVTNTELITVSGEKVWLDDLDEHSAITVELLANGTKVNEVEVNVASDWNYEFTDLVKYDASGEAITYTVDEVDVDGYETIIDGFNITNLRVGTTELSGEKIWLDDESEDRPDSITVNLLANGEVVDTDNVTSGSNWEYEFTGLDKYNDQGVEITYTVDEEDVEGYEKSVEGNDITNLRVGTTEVEVTKLWKDEHETDRPETITVNLLQNGDFYEEYEVTKENDWKLTIADLPQYDEAGKAYEYTVTEHDVAGYAADVDGLEITNTRSDVKTIEITKTWLDNDSEDRPASIEVELFRSVADGDKELVETYTVTAADWSLEVSDLPTFDNDGKAYTYEIEEKEVDGYETKINGFELTNLRVGETEVEGTKTWLDNDSVDRPEAITVQLLANGEETDQTAEVTAETEWQYEFTELPKYDDKGLEITYSVDEEEVVGYEKSIEGNDITNLRVGTTKVEVTKLWQDENEDDRPDTIKINLLQNGDFYEEYEITKEAGWELTITDLPQYDDQGKAFGYTVTEHDVAGYASEADGLDITNTRADVKSIEITKTWLDNDSEERPESIEVELFRSVTDGDKELVETYLVTANNDWSLEVEDLPSFDNDGKAYTYEIQEKVVEGYETKINGFDITNLRVGTTELSGEKIWLDDESEDRPESITAQLYVNGEETEMTTEVSAESNWEYEFTGLAKYDDQGIEITYTVDEVDVPKGYQKSIEDNDITNLRVGETEVTGTKTWLDDNSEDRPDSITVYLLANGEEIDEAEALAASNWEYTFTELPKYDDQGVEVSYSVDELEVDGYEKSIENSDITNLRVGTTELIGEKTWLDDNSEDRPDSIIVQLLANEEVVDFVEVDAGSNWAYEFINLDQYDEQGKEIMYSIDEEAVEGYQKSIEGNDITNLRVGTTEVEVAKLWKDEQEIDRPDTITVNLLQNGTVYEEYEVTMENDWKLTITDLPQYDETGKAYEYTVTEHDVAGYEADVNGFEITNTRTDVKTIEISKSWLDNDSEDRPTSIEVELFRSVTDGEQELVDTYKVTANNNWSLEIADLPTFDNDGKAYTYEIKEKAVDGYETTINGFDITNLRVGETVVEGTKTWLDDNSDDRPETITVYLFANGEEIDEVDVTVASNWEYTFIELPKYDEQGVEINYSVDESEIDGYEKSIDGNNLTNLRIGTTEVSGEKTWVEVDEQYRPDSITVSLLANGEELLSTESSAETDWKFTFTDLAKYDAEGKEITYTIEEVEVPGYVSVVEGYDITNTQETTEITGTKTWKDDDAVDRPLSINVQVMNADVVVQEQEVTAEDDWNFTFTDLAKYDTEGNEIEYTINELPVPGYATEIDGSDITNTKSSIVDIAGTKTWKDDNAEDRPASITVQLLANGEVIDSIEVTAETDWTYIFENQDGYDAAGVAILYTVAELEVEGYKTLINGFDITNTLIPVEEDSEDPEQPVSGGESGDKDPKDPKDPTDVDGEVGEGKPVPKTATNMYNLALIGFGLMLLGLILFLVRRKRIE